MNYDYDFHEFSNMAADSILKNINTIRELDRFETYATECGFIDNVIMKINNRRDEIKEFYKKEQIRKQKMKDEEIAKKEAERMNMEKVKEDIAKRTRLGERITYELAKGTLSDEVFTEVLMFYISRTGKNAKRPVEELISLENKDRVAFLATCLMDTVDTAREAFNIFIEKDIKVGTKESLEILYGLVDKDIEKVIKDLRETKEHSNGESVSMRADANLWADALSALTGISPNTLDDIGFVPVPDNVSQVNMPNPREDVIKEEKETKEENNSDFRNKEKFDAAYEKVFLGEDRAQTAEDLAQLSDKELEELIDLAIEMGNIESLLTKGKPLAVEDKKEAKEYLLKRIHEDFLW